MEILTASKPSPAAKPSSMPSTAVPVIDAKLPAVETKPPAAPAKSDPKPDEDDFSSDLDKLGSEPDEPIVEKAPEVEPVAKTPSAPEKGKETDEPQSAGDLRKAYSSVKTERDALKKQVEDLGKRTSKEDPETKAIIEDSTRAKTRLQELETEIKNLKYERSSEYNDRYRKPMEKAFQSAIKEVTQMTVTTDEGERPATSEDFTALIRVPTQQAASRAKNMFGDAAAEVLGYRRKILDLDQQRQEAVEEYRTKGAQSEQEQIAHQATETQRLRGVWEQESKGVLEKYPQYFGPEEGDDEGNATLEKGFKLADLAFLGAEGLPPEKLLQIRADIRARAAGFGRMVQRNKRLEVKVEALTKELEEYKRSEPGTGGNAGTRQVVEEDWEASIDKLATSEK